MSKQNKPASSKRASAKAGEPVHADVEPMVIALAEQLGTFLGRVQRKADGWLDKETLRQQVEQIRESAAGVLKQVNDTGAAVRDSATAGQIRDGATKLMKQVDQSTASVRKSASKTVAKAVAAVTPKKAAKKAAPPAKLKLRSGGAVDAPGKKHRKPPPQERVDRHLSKPGKPMGQNGARGRMQRGGSNS